MPVLTKDDSDSGDFQTNTTGVETVIWEKTVEKGQIFDLGAATQAMRIFLQTHDQFDGDGTTTTFSLTDNILDVPKVTDTGENAAGYVGGTSSSLSSVDFSADSVTFSSAPSSGTGNVDVFYNHADGDLKLKILNNRRAGREEKILQTAVRALHQQDQYQTPPDIPNNAIVGEDMVIRLTLNSSVQIANDSTGNSGATPAANVFRLPYVQRPDKEKWRNAVDEFVQSMGE